MSDTQGSFKLPYLRWWIIGLLFLSTIINYLSRQTLSVLAPMLRDQFNLSNTDYSHIVFAFLFAYMIMQAGSGRIIDWVGAKIGMVMCVVWWSIASILHIAAGTATQFGICRFLLGMGEAGNWPGAVKVTSEWFPAKERALATAIFNSGSCVGALIAPPMVVWIAVAWNWRAAFAVTGVLGFLWAILWWLLYDKPAAHRLITAGELNYITGGGKSQDDAQQGKAVSDKSYPSWSELLRDRNVLMFVFARMLADPVWWFYVFWLPEYFKREREFSMAMIGYFVWIPFLTADIGNFVGGGLSSFLVKSGWSVPKARKIVMLGGALGMMGGIPAVLTGSGTAALIIISIVTLSYSAWATNILTLPADIFEQEVVASVTGLAGTGGGIGGIIFTLVTGFVVDRFSYVPIFAAAAVMPLLAALIIMFGIKTKTNE